MQESDAVLTPASIGQCVAALLPAEAIVVDEAITASGGFAAHAATAAPHDMLGERTIYDALLNHQMALITSDCDPSFIPRAPASGFAFRPKLRVVVVQRVVVVLVLVVWCDFRWLRVAAWCAARASACSEPIRLRQV